MSDFLQWKHYIGVPDIDGITITEERLKAWSDNPKRKLICIFCGSAPSETNGFVYCKRCREYKGIMPDVGA